MRWVRRLPLLSGLAQAIQSRWKRHRFRGSAEYWNNRYLEGGSSGPGSCGVLAEFKAHFLNRYVAEHNISSVVEFGCGDGNQLSLARYPAYIGLDTAAAAIVRCGMHFSADVSKSFYLYSPTAFFDDCRLFHADLSISLDVIYHLVEDEIYERYMNHLFLSADKYVIIYSSNDPNLNKNAAPHVKHRNFTSWIENNMPEWRLLEVVENDHSYDGNCEMTSFADFYVYVLTNA